MFKNSNTKQFINDFLADLAPDRALVIDAESLMTSKSLGNGVDITVLNSDPTICKKAQALGLNTACGISTVALREVHGKFNIIYLDYCGFPTKQPNGFDPAFDLLWAADHLVQDGLVLATFSRRFQNCAATAESLIPNSLQLAKTHTYFETSAMMCMFLVKENARAMRDSINHALLTKTKSTETETETKTKTKTKTTETESTETKTKTKSTKTKSTAINTKKPSLSRVFAKLSKSTGRKKRDFLMDKASAIKGRKRKKREFLMEEQASERSKPAKHAKPTKPNKKYAINTNVLVKWKNETFQGVVLKKTHGGYDIYFPLTNNTAIVKTSAVSVPVEPVVTANC